MKSYNGLLLILAMGLGILIGVPAPAADAVNPEKIQKLIAQLGSDAFEDREKASEQLDAIGAPALEALRQAAKSKDSEVQRRAADLVSKIEKRGESRELLAPSKVHLVYHNTPVADAVTDFCKKSGYPIVLMDPQNKLKNRKVSLDTGEVTFWQAFDLFCKQASLVEASANDVMRLMPQPGLPGGIRQPIPQPGLRPVPPAPLPPTKPVPQTPGNQRQAPQPPQQGVQAPPQPAVPPNAVVQVQVQVRAPLQPAQPAQPPVAQLGGAGFGGFGGQLGGMMGMMGIGMGGFPGANQIILVDGKPKALPTDAASAVRVRTSDHIKQMGKPPANEIRVGLQVTPEPKLQVQQVVAVRVTKAIDDKDQKLDQIINMNPNPVGPGINPFGGQLGFAGAGFAPGAPGIALQGGLGGMIGMNGMAFGFAGGSQYTMVQFKKAEKASKTLKELTGVITAQVLAPSKPVITVDNIMKMAGKEGVKGKDGGLIKILEATRGADDQLKVRFEFEPPGGNAGNPFGGQGGIILPAVPIAPPRLKLVPLPPAPPVPPAPPQKQAAPPPPKEGQAQAQPAQPPQPPQAKVAVRVQAAPAVQIQIAQPGGIQIGFGGPGGFGMFQFGGDGFSLLDDKGKKVPQTGFQTQLRQDGNTLKVEHVLTFRLEKGQEAAKLLYSISKPATIDIPFTLKNVTLP